MNQPEMSWQGLKCDWDGCPPNSILQKLVGLLSLIGFVSLVGLVSLVNLVALLETAVEKSSMHYSSDLDP